MTVRILVVDDSAFVRKAVTRMLSGDPELQIVAQASNGRAALSAVRALSPDVVTLDLHMPGMDGMATLRRIMAEQPTPVVLLSSYSRQDAALTLKALAVGAVDFVDKSRVRALDLYDLADELIAKVKAAAVSRVMIGGTTLGSDLSEAVRAVARARLFVIGASTGGPAAIARLLGALPDRFPAAVIVAQHMPEGFTREFAGRLDAVCSARVAEAQSGDPVESGGVLVAPGGSNVALRQRGARNEMVVLQAPPSAGHTPSIDLLLTAAAELYGSELCAIILTGMGCDGELGARAVRTAGGTVVAESAASCVVYGMPRAVVDAGLANVVAPLEQIAAMISVSEQGAT